MPKKATAKNPVGRPSSYSEAVCDDICNNISEGVPLKKYCREHGIAWRTIYLWIDTYPDFATRYQKARDMGMDAIFEEALEIADNMEVAMTTTSKISGLETKEEDALGHRKLRIETRFKLLSKWNPKKYGERATFDITTNKSPDELTDEELMAIATRRGKGDAESA